MPPPFTLIINFNCAIQDSVSVGDIAYGVVAVPNSSFNVNQQNITKLGEIIAINRGTSNGSITIQTDLYINEIPEPKPNGDEFLFVLFSKDNCQEYGSMLGYFGSFKFKNNSDEFSELFNVTVDAFESSK